MAKTERELRIASLIQVKGLDPSDVLVCRDNTIRGRETVLARFRVQGGYVTVSVDEGVDSTDETTASEIVEQALRRGMQRPKRNGIPDDGSERHR